MKKIKRKNLHYGALVALGVFLGRGAHADTVLDFNDIPPNQTENSLINQGFGSAAAASSEGVTVNGFGTTNITLTWTASGASDTEWDYYDDGGNVWTAVQLNDSDIGDSHSITFSPTSPSVSVDVESFNFDPYYDDTERFTYNITLLSGTNILKGPTIYTFLGDAQKDHPVVLNYTGAPGQTLKLRLDRIASTLTGSEVEGGAFNIAVDDIAFAQTPATNFPVGPQVTSVTPSDDATGIPATFHPYLASIANNDTSLVASSIQLKLDYNIVTPPPVISTDGTVTNVSSPGTNLLASGMHVYTLIYQDNAGGFYTNEVAFSSSYATLPAMYALPTNSGSAPGFTYRTVSANTQVISPDQLDSSLARAMAQLAGTLINTTTAAPYLNDATPGPNPDGSYNVDTVLNFSDDGMDEGDFTNDVIFPGLVGNEDWFSTEALLYLDLPAGYYRLGVNSDDGFEVNALPPKGVSGSPITLGKFDGGKGAGDVLFDLLVPTSGIYPFQVIYFESTGDAECEFFSVTNFATAGKILINDTNYPNAIISYRSLSLSTPLTITGIAQNGTNVVISWANGNPPFQLHFESALNNSWANFGSPTTNTSETVPIQPGTGFFRVSGQ